MKFAWLTTFLLVLILVSRMDAGGGKKLKKEVSEQHVIITTMFTPVGSVQFKQLQKGRLKKS